MRYKIEKNTVQETLIIPLYARKMCSELYPNLYRDEAARRLVNAVDYDFSALEKKSRNSMQRFGFLEVAMRQNDLAFEVREYLKSHPNAAVVNLGCGLDSTGRACDNGKCKLYNLDFPDVIAVRNELLPAGEREENIPCDLNDTSWFERIDASGGAVFFAAGVFYYFLKEQVKTLVRAMADAFPGAVLVFDAANEKAVKLMLKTWLKDAEIKDVGAYFAVSDAKSEIGAWDSSLRVSSRGYMLGYNDLKGPSVSGFFRFLARVGDGMMRMQIVKIKFRGKAMKHQHFDVGTAGFYGAYWACAGGSDCAVIAMIGDDPEDRLARSAAKWLCGRGVNVLTMSPAKKDYGHHNYPLERVETAISWLKANGNKKIGIAGASTTGTFALTAAAMFPEITLTIAMTPSDFVWQGFMQGKKDGCKEWPVEGESLFSYAGKPLPYMPFCYQHPDYWHCIAAESKRTGDMVNSRKLFDDSEAAHPIEPEEYIPVENIRGKLLLIGAEDDALWDTAKYIRRMEKRLAEKPHECEVETAVYAHGTHFVFPEGMLKIMLPMGAGLFVRLAFQAAKQFPEACRQTRQDIDRRVSAAIHTWTSTE